LCTPSACPETVFVNNFFDGGRLDPPISHADSEKQREARRFSEKLEKIGGTTAVVKKLFTKLVSTIHY